MSRLRQTARSLWAALGSPPGGLRQWLLPASALHAALVALLALRELPSEGTAPAVAPGTTPDLLWLEDAPPPSLPTDDLPPSVRRVEDAPPPVPARSAMMAYGTGKTQSVTPSAGSAASGVNEADLEPPSIEGEPAEPGPDAAHAGSAPHLSLRDLGVGAGNNLFFGPDSAQPSRAQVLNQRLQQSLNSELLAHDQKLGLGPEGPALAAIKNIVLESPTTNTSGLLALRIDAEGRVVHVEVLQASSDSEEWARMAKALEQALAQRRLRVPPRATGMTMKLRVTSRVQMPSGADPGFAIEAFGQTLKEGAGDRSAALKLFDPELIIQDVEVPYTDGRHTIPMPSVSIGGLSGDLADIGAVAQRIVSAYLVAMDTDFAGPASTQPGPREAR